MCPLPDSELLLFCHGNFGILTTLIVGCCFFMLLGDILAGSPWHVVSLNPECSQVNELVSNHFCVLGLLVKHSEHPVLCRFLLLARAG